MNDNLYLRIDENTKEVLQCLNSSLDEILETDILYLENAAPCYKIQVLDSQGYPLYIYEDSQLIPVTEDQRFKFHIEGYKLEKLSQIDRDFTLLPKKAPCFSWGMNLALL